MELNEKLQQLRKQRGLTQEELAASLYVSRTAVSKWESGRGYPNLESLKAISALFGVTIDQLLSGEEFIAVAEEDRKQVKTHCWDLVFGLLDCSVALFFFLPFFRQKTEGAVQSVSLLSFSSITPYVRIAYIAAVLAIILTGILTLAMQNCRQGIWTRNKRSLSFLCSAAGSLLFIIGLQPYAAALLFAFLAIKVLLVIKKQ